MVDLARGRLVPVEHLRVVPDHLQGWDHMVADGLRGPAPVHSVEERRPGRSGLPENRDGRDIGPLAEAAQDALQALAIKLRADDGTISSASGTNTVFGSVQR